ncbi:hypothetical protein GCM10008018_00480 [Paenibacillus marchantiophytorum]|uniref:N-acetyltransferase domain-containing protein n=1 Tax=Paenibacillus marchantiophytorum TaxID=1619310 RepID=A0ABQ2BNW3_9BACL|nr:GNAT family N-acetyltransferase [Paenibacillus marchantiophytorum]GGI43123.1 hypothetical protein GCM10008018_00480 [Paenibacillus marchantiophytorum]
MSKELQIDLNNIVLKSISLADIEVIKNFKCGNSSIENFLITEAFQTHILREASTTLVYLDDELCGFFTLQRLPLSFDTTTVVGLHDQHKYSLDIARLGVASAFQKFGIGTFVINYVIDLAQKTNERFVTTDSVFEKWEWYRDRGFNYLIESETKHDTTKGLVSMLLELYDEKFVSEFFDE